MAHIRIVSPDEWHLWRDLRLQALADAPDAFGSSLAYWKTADEHRWRARLEEVPFNVVAMIDDRAVGQASGTAVGDDGCVELISLWVAPEVRGAGAADELVGAVCEWARGLGAAAVRASVRRANGRAIGLYRRAGFLHVDEPGDEPAELAMVRSLPG